MMASQLNYNDFVVVAEDEWKLECPAPQANSNISENLGGFEWRVTFEKQCRLALECVELKQGIYSGDVHAELFIYGRQNDAANANYELWSPQSVVAKKLVLKRKQPCISSEDSRDDDEKSSLLHQLQRRAIYVVQQGQQRQPPQQQVHGRGRQQPQQQQQVQQVQLRQLQQEEQQQNNKRAKLSYPNPMRAVFKQGVDCSRTFTFDECKEFVVLNMRILKDRPLLHDFTVNQPIGHVANDLTLLVGQQKFYVNKKMLELISPVFHRMFSNPNFVEAKQDTVNTGETEEDLFHDFLLAIIPIPTSKYTALPNSKNLAGLMRLAQYYGVDSLFEKFERSLKLCREMPINERVMLAKKYMGKEFNVGGILHGVNNEELKRVCVALFKANE